MTRNRELYELSFQQTTGGGAVERASREAKGRAARAAAHILSIIERSAAERRLLLDSLLLGIVGALSARFFMLLLALAQHLFLAKLAVYLPPMLASEGGAPHHTGGSHGLWLVPVATTLGGLLSGLLVYWLAPEAEGHGTDTVVIAVHRAFGAIRARVPLVKAIASALTIGSGGSAGREGPTALISAGVASIYSRGRRRTHREQRLLAMTGMAAGLSAIFRSPIGTAVFAIEVLYGTMEFEAGALLYTMVASVVAYVVDGLFAGFGPLFNAPAVLPAPTFGAYGEVAILGVASGVAATVLPVVFYRTRDLFRALPMPRHFKPALGGLVVGLIALWLPQVLGGGYAWIQMAIDGRLATGLLATLLVAKTLTLSLTVGSGGSGGIFAPSLYVGAMLGGLVGRALGLPGQTSAIVGMAAVFGGAARVPVATLLMVTEMTGGYQLLVPAALAVMLSFFVQSLLSSGLRYHSLYEGQVSSWRESPTHEQRVLIEHFRACSSSQSREGRAGPVAPGVSARLADGKELGVLSVPRGWAGATLGALRRALPAGTEVLALFQGDQGHEPPRPDARLGEGDRVVIAAKPEHWHAITLRLRDATRGEPSPRPPS